MRRDDILFGDVAMRGERGLLILPIEWLLRMRYNPFSDVLEQRVLEWFRNAQPKDAGAPG